MTLEARKILIAILSVKLVVIAIALYAIDPNLYPLFDLFLWGCCIGIITLIMDQISVIRTGNHL